jgi:hypothetical protein
LSCYPIRDIFDQFGGVVKSEKWLNLDQLKALSLIGMCKTEKLGSHKEKCTSCGHKRVHYNSCGNRNCPNCQGINKEKWILARSADLLPVKYFHGVFTVPSELRGLFRYNKRLLYDLLFQCVKETLFEFSLGAKQKMEAKPGLISVLHTWNQKMGYHPHVHCIIPAGGINNKGEWKTSKGKDDFLFRVEALSAKFKQKFLILLAELVANDEVKFPVKDAHCSTKSDFYKTKGILYNRDWVVYAKESFGGPEQVMEYLGRYTHKIAISNHRIVKVSDTHVSFNYLNRSTNTVEIRKVTGAEFIQLFLQHVLPKRFIKIRHYGFLSTRSKKVDLAKIRKALKVENPPVKEDLSTRELVLKTYGKDPNLCPKCNKDTMVVVEINGGIRGSPRSFFAKDKRVQLEMN